MGRRARLNRFISSNLVSFVDQQAEPPQTHERGRVGRALIPSQPAALRLPRAALVGGQHDGVARKGVQVLLQRATHHSRKTERVTHRGHVTKTVDPHCPWGQRRAIRSRCRLVVRRSKGVAQNRRAAAARNRRGGGGGRVCRASDGAKIDVAPDLLIPVLEQRGRHHHQRAGRRHQTPLEDRPPPHRRREPRAPSLVERPSHPVQPNPHWLEETSGGLGGGDARGGEPGGRVPGDAMQRAAKRVESREGARRVDGLGKRVQWSHALDEIEVRQRAVVGDDGLQLGGERVEHGDQLPPCRHVAAQLFPARPGRVPELLWGGRGRAGRRNHQSQRRDGLAQTGVVGQDAAAHVAELPPGRRLGRTQVSQ
mmetsp:Transcript_4769/g.15661  ORF Transcript_4769/g.15661 Transcript_4769/m.15661 type:complete len:367 (-) Transcript_4769:436-1536(-)